jgi:membrane protein YqaA with SNARE-associated domain
MDSLTQLLNNDLSLWGLFISSFLAATLLPGGSEAVLFGVLKLHPELFWPALLLGTLGNTLGGMVTFGMGWMLPLRMGGSEAAGPPSAVSTPPNRRLEADCPPLVYSLRVQTQQLKHVEKVRTYGTPALVLAWVPLIGDALCLAAGWLRLNWWQAALFMGIGKFARYWVIAVATHY